MALKDKANPRRARLFRSDRLERLSLITPRGFVATWSVILALLAWWSWGRAGLSASIGLVCAGLLLWTLFEYGMHRFVFHLKLRSPLGQRIMFLAHANHHAVPSDPFRNIMPPLVAIAIVGTAGAAILLALGSIGWVVFLGFSIGYVIYDSLHYACHQLPMQGRLGRMLRQHHNRHHYVDQDGNFSITAIFWDRVFGTHVPAERRRSYAEARG